MTLKDIILKIKKRIHYILAGEKSVETYYFQVVESNISYTSFLYYGHKFRARLKNSSDYDVLRQVLVLEEYKIPLSFLENLKTEPQHIIDAGANIGATSLYFKNRFPGVKIYSIEPDDNNFSLLSENLAPFVNEGSCILLKAGLSGVEGENLQVHSNFGDGRNWAKAVEKTTEVTGLKSITINNIINSHNIPIIDFLKIDIEGGEKFLIDPQSNLDFLSITKCIAVEIHDELDLRNRINEILIANHFFLIVDSQTTIGINKSL